MVVARVDQAAAKLDTAAANLDGRIAKVRAAVPVWPVLDGRALHGPLGDFVRVIEPHTEADPAAILVQTLVVFGSVIGRGPHFRVEADEHHGNVFAAMVGETAKGRKGVSWSHARRLGELVDDVWAGRCVSGLSSGEGLIWQVRDVGDDERATGVDDKRLLVVETELAQALKVLRREGNTLSPTIRCAWDTGVLQVLTKNRPARATGAHISIIGHITKAELLRTLGETEAANGFGNRFLWVCVRRSKCLPDGGSLDGGNLRRIANKFSSAVTQARALGALSWDGDARTIWHNVYEQLSEGKPGLFGAMIGRAEAQVVRIALLYALADKATKIRKEHLLAALAVWDYCEASARFIFGHALGDPVADEILSALRAAPDGLTRDQIRRELFQRNRKAEEIARALTLLQDQNLAFPTPKKTSGRTAEVWKATR